MNARSPTPDPAAPPSYGHPYAHTLQDLKLKGTKKGQRSARFFSLPRLAEQFPGLPRLPLSIRIVLEAVLRHCDGRRITKAQVAQLARWQPRAERSEDIPFVVARVVLQDFTGVPLLADLAAMRHTAARLGQDPRRVEPLVPVDLVVDHSVMIDHRGSPGALDLNMKLEFQRNRERYAFMKWGMQAFSTFGVVPPGFGIVHQVNLEHLARGVHQGPDGIVYPDTLVGTDSHTTMINGIGVVGWGVGGIEAEAAMLGQPVYLLTPDVVGVELSGRLREGVTATDLVLTVTERLRRHKVVGKFVEFFGPGTAALTVPDRATLANMAPEYGATMGFFPVDDQTLAYLRGTGRHADEIARFEAYFRAQGLFGSPEPGSIDYSETLRIDLGEIVPSLAGPKRPQDRIEITHLSRRFRELFSAPASAPGAESGFGQPAERLAQPVRTRKGLSLHHGDVLIAAITSCTNTSNPSVMLAAGLLARKAVEAGLKVAPHIKTSMAPGSRVVTDYLARAGLMPSLEALGFQVAAYGCTTCIGNAGELDPDLQEALAANDLVCAAVLSGNRNFEARIHPLLKANFLASPPLVLAYALAGSVTRDLMTEPVGRGHGGREVYLGDLWPRSEEVHALLRHAMEPKAYQATYAGLKTEPGALWTAIPGVQGEVYDWPTSTYIARPPFFDDFRLGAPAPLQALQGARIMALFGDSITTDHISPAGTIQPSSPAGLYLQAQGVAPVDFNSYGSRRGHHEVMVRGTFANVRLKNLVLPPQADGRRVEGGLTLYRREGAPPETVSIHEAATRYAADGVPTVIFAGEEYGTGSSRDWAAKGTRLLGIRAVIARSFERIHRNNLVGMGVLPLQFRGKDSWQSLGLRGDERVDVELPEGLKAQGVARLIVTRSDGSRFDTLLTLRIDTPIEVAYLRHGGILPFVLRELLAPPGGDHSW